MISFVLHDAAGRIRQAGCAPEFMVDLQNQPGLTLLRGVGDQDTHYVKDGLILQRVASAAELAGATLIGLPVPCSIRINRMTYDCNDPVAVLDFPYPGAYSITVTAFPYLDSTFTLEKS